MRASLVQQGVAVLKELDEVRHVEASDDVESKLEAAVAARRADAKMTASPEDALKDEDMEALIAKRRTARKDKAAGFCPKCGNPILVSDTFCPKCGHALK